MTPAERTELETIFRRWKADPVLFVRQNFQATPDAWQAEALHAIADPKTQRLALKACKGPGKTCVLAWIVLWFLSTRPQAKVAATSITADNLRDNLWSELALWMGRSKFLTRTFEWTKTRIQSREAPETWFCAARNWPKSADSNKQADTLAGLHADYILFVLDESSEIPQAVMATAEAVLAAGLEAKIVQAGNPTRLDGPLYRACTADRHLWQVITITGDPKNPKRSPRVSLEWAVQQVATYGAENPWVLVNVFGEFPPASLNALLGVEDVERAMARELEGHQYEWAQKRIGVDCARYGDDRTVLFPRQGLMAGKPKSMRNVPTTDIAAAVAQMIDKWGAEITFVDDTGGWGHGVIDNLQAGGYDAVPVIYHAKALSPKYKNRRAEMWMLMAEWVKAGGRLPNLPELVGELVTPTYTFMNGVFVLEDKDLVKERLGRSPDLADALAQTFFLPDRPHAMVLGRTRRQHAITMDDEEREGVGRAVTE